MRRICRPLRTGVLAALLIALGSATAAAERVVAIGDIHGAVDAFKVLLERAGLGDTEGHWRGGSARLVLTGDYLDRGPRVRELLDLLRQLHREATEAGGEVVLLLGNHEVMNMSGELRDVDPRAYAAFVDRESEKRRETAYKRWKTLQRRRARLADLATPAFTDAVRDAWRAARPLGIFEYLEAFGPDGDYGAWLRRLPTAAQIGDSIFLHGGISPDHASTELEELNRAVQTEIRAGDTLRAELIEAGLVLPTFSRAEILAVIAEDLTLERAKRQEEEEPSARELRLQAFAQRLDELVVDSLAFGENGPLWFRGYAHWSDELLEPYLPDYLAQRGARRIVVAHTPSSPGRIQQRLDGRIFLIDTGMQSEVYIGGRGAALEIADGAVREIYERETTPPIEKAGALQTPSDPPAADPRRPPYPPRRLLDASGQPLPFRTETEILHFLRTATVIEQTPLGVGITQPDRLLLESGGVRLRAVYHDVDVQRRGVRLRDRGVVPDFRDSFRSQVAAYRVARLLEMDHVPPAVIREVNGVRGSVALWIEDSFMERERVERNLEHPDPLIKTRRFYDLRVFDNLINNIDRTQENILYDGEWKLWLIDHTRAFGLSKRLPDPQRVVRCSRQLWQRIVALDETTLRRQLAGVLSGPEIKSQARRRDRLVELIRAKIAERGEEEVLFDLDAPPVGEETDDQGVGDLPPG